ncbi:hypothetical protein CYMTET_27189 [Cymbomonas tetramitiformis]|uniref:Uncharacterized protein n=1 Tax=Cymbomonas tetramitiformis TaxID=36881 RepID=A0AAE0FQZ2_9CHLO|nr:hypothetical protein CYMTET_27189 [Cymbomonas tetramitiformis]
MREWNPKDRRRGVNCIQSVPPTTVQRSSAQSGETWETWETGRFEAAITECGKSTVGQLSDKGELKPDEEDAHTVLLRTGDAPASSEWYLYLAEANARLYEVSSWHATPGRSGLLEPPAPAAAPVSVEAEARQVRGTYTVDLDMLAATMHGRPTGGMRDPEEVEVPLLALHCSAARIRAVQRPHDMQTQVLLQSTTVQDHFCGAELGEHPQYFMRPASAEQRAERSPSFHVAQRGCMRQREEFTDACENLAAEPPLHKPSMEEEEEEEEEFYDAEEDALGEEQGVVYMEFTTRAPLCPEYKKVDADLLVKVSMYHFVAYRRTVQALLALERELRLGPDPLNPVPVPSKEPDNERVGIQLRLLWRAASLRLLYDDGGELADMHSQEFEVEMKGFPRHLDILTILRGLKIANLYYPADNVYHWAVSGCGDGGRPHETTVRYVSEERWDKERRVHDALVTVRSTPLHVAYFNSFVQELVAFFLGVFTRAIRLGTPPPEGPPPPWGMRPLPFACSMDIDLEAPVLCFPRNLATTVALTLLPARLRASNRFERSQMGPSSLGLTTVEKYDIELEGLEAGMLRHGGPGGTDMSRKGLVQAVEDLRITLTRPMQDPQERLPLYDIAVTAGKLHVRLSNSEYQFLLATLAENFTEPHRGGGMREEQLALLASQSGLRETSDSVDANEEELYDDASSEPPTVDDTGRAEQAGAVQVLGRSSLEGVVLHSCKIAP